MKISNTPYRDEGTEVDPVTPHRGDLGEIMWETEMHVKYFEPRTHAFRLRAFCLFVLSSVFVVVVIVVVVVLHLCGMVSK